MRLSRPALAGVMLGHLALILGFIEWSGLLVGALLSIPLLATLPGLLRRRTYTAGWASMLLVIYAALLLSEGTANPERRSMAHFMSSAAMFDFVSLVLFVRLAARERAAEQAAQAVRTESSADVVR